MSLLFGLSRKFLASSRTIPFNRISLARNSSSMASLTPSEVSRYSRQMLLPEIGVEGQKRIKNSSILIVGGGGLGCPASLYLTAAGFGRIGIVDDDVVETSNLHRQVLHNEERVGMAKVDSAAKTLEPLNYNVQIEPIKSRLTRENAIEIINKYDIVLDATDNAATRYLLSDVCVLTKKPLVSGAALRFEGQLTVYNYDETSPCYRCLFPAPPPPGTVTNCSDGGVLGVVPGIIGSLQAMEAIKIAAGIKPSFSGKMLLYDGLEGTFRNVKIRNRREDCVSCGKCTQIGPELMDYDEFCGVGCHAQPPMKILAPEERMTCKAYSDTVLGSNVNHILIDVRPKVQADMSKVDHSLNIPLAQLQKGDGLKVLNDILNKKPVTGIYVMCRRGNASQMAVRFLKDNIDKLDIGDDVEIKDLVGGITAWSADVDPSVPVY
ncbi:Adenylyltransferase and sulfurtransferase MOCS3 [Halotydeus destructor]|nr:Adenylyltransferase and sulfurtransferase MOCS3 [Halotydeus destructor]